MIKNLIGILFLLVVGCCVLGMLFSGNVNNDATKDQATNKEPNSAGQKKRTKPSKKTSADKTSNVEASNSQPIIYVADDVEFEISQISSHMSLVASEMAFAYDLEAFDSKWLPTKSSREELVTVIKTELEFLNSRMRPEFPEVVHEKLTNGLSIIKEDIEQFADREPRAELIDKIWSFCLNKVKAESHKSLPNVPQIELRLWTEDRIKKYAKYPASVSLGWFNEVIPSKGNRGARVLGTFKAANAFGAKLKQEYLAVWSLNKSDKWQLDQLSFDGKVIYVNPDVVDSISNALLKGEQAYKEWGPHREKVKSASSKLQNANDGYHIWIKTAREFTSDKGTKLQARYAGSKSRSGKTIVSLEKDDGAKLEVDVERLSAGDRKFLSGKMRSSLEIEEWNKNAHLFTSNSGSTMKAVVKSFNGGKSGGYVVLERLDTSTVKVQMNDLIKSDQDYVREELNNRR